MTTWTHCSHHLGQGIQDANGEIVAVVPNDRDDAWADAALISAAPELLDALVGLLPYATAAIGLPRDRWPHDSVILRAERVIAKASGRSA